jgi:hypothetical protein
MSEAISVVTAAARLAGDQAAREEASGLGVDLEANISVRDIRNTSFYWVHNLIIDDYGPLLGPFGHTVYSNLCLMADQSSQRCWPTLDAMASHWGMSKSTVSRAIALLAGLGLIKVERTKQKNGAQSHNVYFLLEPPPLKEGLAHLRDQLVHREKLPLKPGAIHDYIMSCLPTQFTALRNSSTFKTRDDWQDFVALLCASDAIDPGSTAGEHGSTLEQHSGSPVERSGLLAEHSSTAQLPQTHQVGTADASEAYANNTPDKQASETKNQEDNTNTDQDHVVGVVLQTEEEIESYALADDEVFTIDSDDQVVVRPVEQVTREDIVATKQHYVRQSTDCYYSAAHVLGTSDDWSEEENARYNAHRALRERLEREYADLGAFSVRDALLTYFEVGLADTLFRSDPAEERRIRGWIRHVRSERGASLSNPPGFLRSRIESGAVAPPVPGRRRGR